ncbi:MAG: hypothetical protein JWQ42_3038 [Edaphobacter sp.]|nr:hypothetical protein [Edaphobacter sp.]
MNWDADVLATLQLFSSVICGPIGEYVLFLKTCDLAKIKGGPSHKWMFPVDLLDDLKILRIEKRDVNERVFNCHGPASLPLKCSMTSLDDTSLTNT